VVWLRATEVYVVDVVDIVVHVVKGATELSQFNTLPVWPLNVRVPLVWPEQIDDPPETAPPSVTGLTVTVAGADAADAHTPLCTTARNCVVCVSAPEVWVVEVLLIGVQVVNGETELSHPVIVPVWPLSVSVPLVEPVQMVALPAILPPADAGSTVTVADVEFTDPQVPLWITARNWLVWLSAPEVYVVAVLVISDHVLNGATDDCHFNTDPVWPLTVKVPLAEPSQMVEPPLTLPPTDATSTVTVVAAELAAAHVPLWTTALNWVVCVNAPEV
jgi:hypothetical protein